MSARLMRDGHASASYRLVGLDGVSRDVVDRARCRRLEDGDLVVYGMVTLTDEAPGDGASARLGRLLESVDAFVYTMALDAATNTFVTEFAGGRTDLALGVEPPPGSDLTALWRASVHPEDEDAVVAHIERLKQGEASSLVFRVRGLDRRTRWMLDRSQPRRDRHGRVVIDGLVREVGADVLAGSDDDADEHDRLTSILHVLDELLYEYEIVDGDVRVLYASPGLEGLAGGPLPEGTTDVHAFWNGLVHPDDQAAQSAHVERLRRGEPSVVEYRVVGLDGVTRRLWSRAMPHRDAEGRTLVAGVISALDPHGDEADAPSELTARQREVMSLLAAGFSTDAIAARLSISVATVRNHVTAILTALGAHSRLEAVAIARRAHLV